MAFWKWRSSSRPVATPPPPAEDGSPLVLLTRGGRLSGRAKTDGRRVTDVLNESDEVVMRVESRDEVYAGGSPWASAPSSDAGTSGQSATESVMTDDILVVIPPAHQSSRQMQIHRRTRRVELQIGPYRVEGHAHVTPGVPLDAYVARLTSRFIPLTRVQIEGPGIDEAELPFETAIVNVRAIVALEALS